MGLLQSSQVQEDGVEAFLEENNVHPSWRQMILENEDIREALKACLDNIVNNRAEYPEFVPARRYVLRALAYLPPKDIKAIFVGHDPIPGDLATGLAFSFPRGRMFTKPSSDFNVKRHGRGKTVVIIHDVLCRAGFLKEGEIFDCCAEVWAHRGVILWNGALTFHPNDEDEKRWNELMDDGHYKLWTTFGTKLFTRLLEVDPDIQVLCIGSWGGNIGEQLQKIPGADVSVCDHPTYTPPPRKYYENNFKEEGEKFFKAVKCRHPVLFSLTPEVDNLEEKSAGLNDDDK